MNNVLPETARMQRKILGSSRQYFGREFSEFFLWIPITSSAFRQEQSTWVKEVICTVRKDYYNCYFCVNNFISFTAIQDLIKTQEKNSTVLNEIKYIRCLFNILNTMNVLVILAIFSGPRFITIMMCITTRNVRRFDSLNPRL